MTEEDQAFYVGQWVYFHDIYPFHGEHKGQIDQINWVSDHKCWFYIIRETQFRSLISVAGNDKTQMNKIRPWN
jgi:hypothetical protein